MKCVQDGDDPKVIQYSGRGSHKKQWAKFRQEVFDNPARLFVTIADECHWGPKAFQAHDQMVNDCVAPQQAAAETSASGRQNLLLQKNYIVLLVSATPYNVLSRDSRIPEEYVVLADPSDSRLKLHDILHQPDRYRSLTQPFAAIKCLHGIPLLSAPVKVY